MNSITSPSGTPVAKSGFINDEAGVKRRILRAFDNVAAGQTDDAQVAAVAGHRIRVINLVALCAATATTLTFNSKPAGAGAAIYALLANAVNGGEVLPRNEDGWFETNSGEGLSVTTGAGSTTGIAISYILVPNYLTDEDGIVLTDENGIPLTA